MTIQPSIVDFREGFGNRDFVLITLDALRYDAAFQAWPETPNLRGLIPIWQPRHSPGTFTLPAHEAFFAGFFPRSEHLTEAQEERPMALRMPGARSTGPRTLQLQGPDIVRAYARAGYHTLCVGGVSFFDPKLEAGAEMTRRFAEVAFRPDWGVRGRHASARAIEWTVRRMSELPSHQRLFLFMNFAATHPPTSIFLPPEDPRGESLDAQVAALVDWDKHLPRLLETIEQRGGAMGIICGDHGTCFGEDGRWGHRIPHPLVWRVPYAEFDMVAP